MAEKSPWNPLASMPARGQEMVAKALLELDFGRTERLEWINGSRRDLYVAGFLVVARANL